jgi:hypothetical protein
MQVKLNNQTYDLSLTTDLLNFLRHMRTDQFRGAIDEFKVSCPHSQKFLVACIVTQTDAVVDESTDSGKDDSELVSQMRNKIARERAVESLPILSQESGGGHEASQTTPDQPGAMSPVQETKQDQKV